MPLCSMCGCWCEEQETVGNRFAVILPVCAWCWHGLRTGTAAAPVANPPQKPSLTPDAPAPGASP